MNRFIPDLCLLGLSAATLLAQIDLTNGTVIVRVLYQGQVINGCGLAFDAQAAGNYGCGNARAGVPVGNYTLSDPFHPVFPPIPFSVAAGQTTNVDVEISAAVGAVTGIVLANGVPPLPTTVGVRATTPGKAVLPGGTDSTGRFQFLAFAGAGSATVSGMTGTLATFPYTAVPNSLDDVGTINIDTGGTVTVRVLYQGQVIAGCGLGFQAPGAGGFGCGNSRSGMPSGNYVLSEPSHPEFAPVNFTVTSGQNTAVGVEISSGVGAVTGTVLTNGVPPPPTTVIVRSGKEVLPSGTDAAGQFRLLAFPGPATGTVTGGVLLATFPHDALANTTVDVGTITANTGSIEVKVKYQGQLITGCSLNFVAPGAGSFGCGNSRAGIPTGAYTLSAPSHPVFPPINFAVNAAQTTNINVEISSAVGEVTGIVLQNGVPPPVTTVIVQSTTGNVRGSGTDLTGRFRFLAFAGTGTGTAGNIAEQTNFGYVAVANQTRDLGVIGSTSLKATLSTKSGTLPNKTWNIRISNTGVNAANIARLDNVTFGQTGGPACSAPVVTSVFPITAGLLAPGSSLIVPFSINFGTCAPAARFTVTYYSSANGGSATGVNPYTLQTP